MTFLSLGAYYQGARNSVLDPDRAHARAQLQKVARNSAVYALTWMKESLSERWTDQRAAGGYSGGTYRTVAVLRRNRGTVRAVGLAGEGEEEGYVESYRIRADVLRQWRTPADASSGYDVIMKVPTDEHGDDPIPFIESSRAED